MDTSYIDVDVNPTYVRVTVKGKILQLTLPCEISVERSKVQRNTITGSLVITMARLAPCTTIIAKRDESASKKEPRKRESKVTTVRPLVTSRRALLEIGPASDILDFLKITEDPTDAKLGQRNVARAEERTEDDFQDNPDVPALE